MKTTIIILILTAGIFLNTNSCSISGDTPERQWWNSLNDTWKIVFLMEIDKIGKNPTNEDLFRIIRLESVNCDHFPLGESNLEPLRELKRLKSLSAGSTYINSIDALAELDSLEFVNLAATPITDIEALRGHEFLESVYVQQTRISDVSPLENKEKLQVVVLSATEVGSIEALMDNPAMSILELSGTKVPKTQVEEFIKKHNDCEVNY